MSVIESEKRKPEDEIIFEEIQTLLKSNVFDIDFVLKKIVEYGVAKYNVGWEEALVETPNCEDCERIDPDNPPDREYEDG